MNTPTLKTERLILRKFTEEDMEAKYKQPQAYAYAICLKSDNFPIGYIESLSGYS